MNNATGKFEVLLATTGTTPTDLVQKIEWAGRTCYKSQEKITPDSAQTFVRGILKRGHESVIEHSWFVFRLKNLSDSQILPLILASPLLAQSITYRPDTPDWLISGNARMFRDLFRADKNSDLNRALYQKLAEHSPILFTDIALTAPAQTWALELNPPLVYDIVEKRKHWWAMVRFTSESRAFTHQLVRHRLMAISQESQRYCDEKGFFGNDYYVTPPAVKQAELDLWYKEKLQLIDGWYQEFQSLLRQASLEGKVKVKINEDARFLLPNAVCSEIVISTHLQEWRHIFKMRCDKHAQWEIRYLMLEVLKEFQQLFPGVFNDFAFDLSGEFAELKI